MQRILGAISFVGLIGVTSAVTAQGQSAAGSLQDVLTVGTVYGQCVVAAARRYATTRELPADIVSAAFAWCFDQRNALSLALSKSFTATTGLPQPDTPQHAQR
jgi:hypothetical protein